MLLIVLLSIPRALNAQPRPPLLPAAPLTDLTDAEKRSLPAPLLMDYAREKKGDADDAALVERYREIAAAFAGMPPDKKSQFAESLDASASPAERQALAARYAPPPPGPPPWTWVPPPPLVLHLGNDDADLTLHSPTLRPVPGLSLSATSRGGMLAPFGSTGDRYSTLGNSPYAYTAVTAAYDGVMKAMLTVTNSITDLNSHKAFDDPAGMAASSGNAHRSGMDFHQTMGMVSGYGDVGYVSRVSDAVRAAFFAAADTTIFSPTSYAADNGTPSNILAAANAGTLWTLRTGRHQLTAFADLGLEGVSPSILRENVYGVVPSVANGIEYAHRDPGGRRIAVGAEASLQRADAVLRPYVTVAGGPLSTTVAVKVSKGLDPFFPDAQGAGAHAQWSPVPGVKIGVLGSFERDQFNLAPGPEFVYALKGTVDFDPTKFLHIAIAGRVPTVPPSSPVLAGAKQFEDRFPSNGYSNTFNKLLLESPTLADFARNANARSLDSILSAASAFSFSLNKENYAAGSQPWAGNDDAIYARGRAAYMTDSKDPMLQCPGGAAFTAALINAMAGQAGIALHAEAIRVSVPDTTGAHDGHWIAAVNTAPYGFVFVDWGQVVPTYTNDPGRAADIFQALQGIPDVAHYLADSAGHFVAYLFSEDGRIMLHNLTYRSDLSISELDQIFHGSLDHSETDHSETVQRFRQAAENSY